MKKKNKDILEQSEMLDMFALGGVASFLNPATVFDVSSDLLVGATGNAVTQMVRSLREGERERRLTTKNTGAVMANGGEVSNVPVEVEGGEMMETPDGQVAEIEGPTHENGGVKTELPEGTKIYSDRLKVNGKTMSERKQRREQRLSKIAKLLEKSPQDKILQETFDRTQKLNQAEEMKDMQYQEKTNDFFSDAESLGFVPEMKHGGYINFNTDENYAKSALKMANGGYLKDKNTYVTKDGKETKRGLWANVYLKNKREGKMAYGGKVYANGTPPEGVVPTQFKTNEDVGKLVDVLYGANNADNVKKLQQAIVDSGYKLKGGADGAIGPATRGFFADKNKEAYENLLTGLAQPSQNQTTALAPTIPGGDEIVGLDGLNFGTTRLGTPTIAQSSLPGFTPRTQQLGTVYPFNTQGGSTFLNPDQQVTGTENMLGQQIPVIETREDISQNAKRDFEQIAPDLLEMDPKFFKGIPNLPLNFKDLPPEQQAIALMEAGLQDPPAGTPIENAGGQGNLLERLGESLGIGGDGTDAGTGTGSDLGLTRGDLMGLAGNIQGKYGPLATTLLNRMETPANVNMFREFGADALRAQEEAIGLATTNRDKALQDARMRENAMRARGRNTARSINTLRALDIAGDMQAGQAEQGAYNAYANQMMQLLGQKASLENVQDQMVMKGEQARDLADRQDIDNFYTNLAQNVANISEFTQKTGRDLNQAIYNQDFLSAMENMSQYNIGVERDAQGKIQLVYKGNKQANQELETKKQKAKEQKAKIQAGTSGNVTITN